MSSRNSFASTVRFAIIPMAMLSWLTTAAAPAAEVTGSIVDAETGIAIPCRLYIQNLDTLEWHSAKSADATGSAVEYRKQLVASASVEIHTTLSAAEFVTQLAPGRYRIRAEHGKEFLPAETEISVTSQPLQFQLVLRRFANMGKQGWYSGDTHVHQNMADLPNVVMAEDLNVASATQLLGARQPGDSIGIRPGNGCSSHPR